MAEETRSMANTPPPIEPTEAATGAAATTVRRPFRVTILALGVLIITVANLTRFVLSLREWNFLASQPGVSPLYLALSGLVWTLIGTCLVWGLWSARPWAPRLMQAGTLTYALYYWLDMVFLQDHPVSGAGEALRAILPTNWLFSAIVTIVCLAFMAWTLSRAKVQAYFAQARSAKPPKLAEEQQEKTL